VVDAFDDPTAEVDLATYRTQYGLPACTTANGCFEKVNQQGQHGSYPSPNSGWATEESLDVDMVSAACPNCHIILVEANDNSTANLGVAENEAVTLGAKYVSNSWASCEYSGETSDDQYFDHPGVAITAAGGDSGYDNYLQGCTSPNHPASSQHVTSVGGTRLTRDSGVARGWTEKAWSPDPYATGSGCSQYEAKPAWQEDSGCSNRMTNDVSAVADPATGVAIYDTTGQGGWLVVGGTSAATPVIAAVYALAGSPQADTNPASYPYLNATGLNDVTSGSDYNQSCTPAYFCMAGPGYDGPTGVGTPDGVAAFSPVQAGTLAGTVTDAATGQPITGATVTAGPFTGTTNSSGQYSLTVAAGSFTVAARAFGYVQKGASGVRVTAGQTTTQNFALATAAAVPVTGTVTDGSGQGWPLYASISISGDPNGPVYTNPYTGAYRVNLPGQASYKLTITPLYPGYKAKTVTVTVGRSGSQKNAAVAVNTAKCDAPGYALSSGACGPVSGGLVAGVVSDANTGKPANGVKVADAGGQSGTSASTADPAVPGGFYWLFASPPGPVSFTASGAGYQSGSASVTVAAGAVTRQDWSLQAGQLSITPAGVSATVALGQAATRKVTFTNTGASPVKVSLGTQAGSFTPAGQPAAAQAVGAPLEKIKGHFTPGPGGNAAALQAAKVARTAYASSGKGWAEIAPYPTLIAANAAATDPQTGRVYSVGGTLENGQYALSLTRDGYVYDPAVNTWSPIAPAPAALYEPVAAFVDGTLYVAGGWTGQSKFAYVPSAAVYAYTPGSNSWSQVASLPTAEGGSMAAVLGGQLYVVGGCSTSGDVSCNQDSAAVYRYDPSTNTWATLASYPIPVGYGACAGLDGQVVCTGGHNAANDDLSATYLYDPVTNTWTRGASIPGIRGVGYWGMSYAGANGELEIADGVTNGSTLVTNEAQAYNPVTNTWRLLPNTNQGGLQSASACGFYLIGGGFEGTSAQVLPGYDQCDGAGDASWLSVTSSQATVPAGQSVTVTVRLSAAKVTQPGSYTAALWAATDDPYPVQTIPVSLQVNPPAGWQKITGTVTGHGSPLPGATVAFTRPGDPSAAPQAARADGTGHYQWWLLVGRVQVSVAKDGYQPHATMLTLTKGAPASANFTLKPDQVTSPSHPAGASAAAARHKPSASTSAGHKAASALKKLNATAQVCPAPTPGHAACLSLVRIGLPKHKGLLPNDATPAGYGPSDLQSAYNLPSATAGQGQTVAIVDAGDDPTAEADLATYRKQYGLPACTTANGCFTKVNQDGQQGSYPPDLGWSTEEALDIDMVSAICPSCRILLVEGNSTSVRSLGLAEDEAVKLGAKYVSNSYGTTGAEPKQELQWNKYWNHPGVVVTASAGDSGYGVEFPAASPDVTSVGGTTLTQNPGTSRGWTETAWGSSGGGQGTGSGCSAYEPKPVWQQDTGCTNRTTADVSADADPETGVAIYDSSSGGWVEVGGTSVASPVMASVYALAGPPASGTYPASYPYLHATGLNDVTSGADGTCTPAYLCTAGPGYDGPTGLGTPDGIAAFKPTKYGTLTGTISSASGPVAGVWVTAGGLTATTGSDGSYTLPVPPGTYTVTATRYGYALSTASDVQVTAGQATSQNLTLVTSAKVTVTGTVTDGSGHGWPLYAKVTITGVPGTPAKAYYTSPFTGKYSIQLPGQNTYTLNIMPNYPGYAATSVTVDVGTAAVQHDITVPVAPLACLQAPGYKFSTTGGVYTDFTGWTAGSTPKDGWTTVNNNTTPGWLFGDPPLSGLVGNPTSGSGGYALATPLGSPTDADQDTSLVSPALSLAGVSSPEITFSTAYGDLFPGEGSFAADVDLSLDGGSTWQNVWEKTQNDPTATAAAVTIPIPQAVGRSGVRVRFHFDGSLASLWALDDIQVGTPTCTPVHGGLVAGVVSDANTGQPVNGAMVARPGAGTQPGISASSGDPALPDGFYWLYSSHPGATNLTATDPPYAKTAATVDVAANAATRHDWILQAGQLTADASSLSATATLGRSKTIKVTFRNGGGIPVHVGFGAQDGGFTPLTLAASGAPSRASASNHKAARSAGAAWPGAAASSWAGIAGYPTTIVNNAVAYDPLNHQVFSVGGQNNGQGLPGQAIGGCPGYGHTADAYVYQPSAKAWSPIAPLPEPLESPSAAFLNGRLYVVGGFDCNDDPSAAVYAYTPGSRRWTQVASLPTGAVAPGIAVLNGQLYVVGGCEFWSCSSAASQKVYRYDPSRNTWTKLASYPVYGGVSFGACAGLDGEIACAGGLGTGINNVLDSTYLYNPASDTWTQGADMPNAAYQMASSGSGGQLQIAGGIDADNVVGGNAQPTGQVAQYNPVSNTWSTLPSLPSPEWGGGGACGMYVIGGGTEASGPTTASGQVLPGYSQCDGTQNTGWLPAPRGLTLQPGQSATINVTLDAGKVAQPGIYTANLWAATNTPYPNTVIPVTLHVNPPKGWGLLSGTVTSGGKPIAGATVQVGTTCTAADYCGRQSYTLTAGADGSWQWWLPTSDNGLLVIAAKDGYVQQVTHASIAAGKTLTLNYPLQDYQPLQR
jgi:N-acetylneuraminic acid mutarotase